MRNRLTFLSQFVLSLACAGAAFIAWQHGVFHTIYANDMSMMTSVIAVLFVGTVIYMNWQAWRADDSPVYFGLDAYGHRIESAVSVSSDFGHLAERISVMAGFVGTAIGLSLQAKSLAGGATSFTALSTSLFTTASGGVAAALIAIMTFSLEEGIRRTRR